MNWRDRKPSVHGAMITRRLQAYNTTRNRFPTVLVAGLMGFKEQPYFKADEGARGAEG